MRETNEIMENESNESEASLDEDFVEKYGNMSSANIKKTKLSFKVKAKREKAYTKRIQELSLLLNHCSPKSSAQRNIKRQ